LGLAGLSASIAGSELRCDGISPAAAVNRMIAFRLD
jgi:hypothetical protein